MLPRRRQTPCLAPLWVQQVQAAVARTRPQCTAQAAAQAGNQSPGLTAAQHSRQQRVQQQTAHQTPTPKMQATRRPLPTWGALMQARLVVVRCTRHSSSCRLHLLLALLLMPHQPVKPHAACLAAATVPLLLQAPLQTQQRRCPAALAALPLAQVALAPL
jgi:hypothetical protein